MSKIKVNNENVFQVLAHSFSVTPSRQSFTLSYSANGLNFTDYDEPTPANETLIVNGVAKGMYFKLKGNRSEVEVIY